MNLRNVDPKAWLLCAQWVADVMNHTSEKSLQWRPPLELLTGQTIDISILLCFMFWDIVCVSRYDDQHYKGQIGSEKTSEVRGRFVGFATDAGHALTFKILTDDTQRILNRSRVRLAKDGENNLRLDTKAGEAPQRVLIKSRAEENGSDTLPTVDLSVNPFRTPDEHLGSIQPDLKNRNKDGTFVRSGPDPPCDQSHDASDPAEETEAGILNPNGETDATETEILNPNGETDDDPPKVDGEKPPPGNVPEVETVDEDEPPEDVENDMTQLADREEPVLTDEEKAELEAPYRRQVSHDLVMDWLRTDNPTEPNLGLRAWGLGFGV